MNRRYAAGKCTDQARRQVEFDGSAGKTGIYAGQNDAAGYEDPAAGQHLTPLRQDWQESRWWEVLDRYRLEAVFHSPPASMWAWR